MGFSLEVSVPVVTVFLQGIISFFSPCVLPLLPLYIGYLSGGTGVRGEDGRMHYQQKKVLGHTLCFVVGISFAFFVLGLGVSAIGTFFRTKQMIFARIGGILIVLFGLYQLGVFGTSKVLGKERRLPFQMNRFAMSPVTAFLMGFTFSFAWTPCVGPALTSVLLMAASAGTKTMGFLLIGVYTLGFVLPFLLVGFFTTSLLEFFRKHGNVVQYTVKLGGILMIIMGILMFTGKMNAVTGYLSRMDVSFADGGKKETDIAQAPENGGAEETSVAAETGSVDPDSSDSSSSKTDSSPEERPEIPALDFELTDQFGVTHKLEDYKGKTIFLNFWGTWCPPCRAELPDIQKLYEEYDSEGDDALVVLGVAAPLMGQEVSEEEIKAFLEENGYTYPVLMDTQWELFEGYGIYSFPTTFMIDRDGNVFGYVSGQLSYEIMEDIVRQTMDGERR